MSSSLTIRELEPGDETAWRNLWEGYNAFYGRTGVTALPPEVVDTTWRRFFDADEPVYALVAAQDGRVNGLVHYIFHRTTISLAPTCYLQDLFVCKDARGSGVGRALIQGVYDRAQRRGAPRVYWLTQENNRTAMALYDNVAERPGFVLYNKILR